MFSERFVSPSRERRRRRTLCKELTETYCRHLLVGYLLKSAASVVHTLPSALRQDSGTR